MPLPAAIQGSGKKMREQEQFMNMQWRWKRGELLILNNSLAKV
jgi:hypothetical protein